MKTIFKKALDQWGTESQYDMLVEETGEMLTALGHFKRNRVPITKFMEECADTHIMIQQMRELAPESFDEWVEFKLNRLRTRLDDISNDEPK